MKKDNQNQILKIMKISDYKKLVKPKEHEIQTEIMNYLRAKNWMVFRMNSGAIRTERGGLVRMNPAGTSDVLAIKNGKCTFIEVKRPGNKITRLQEMKMEELSSFGANCFVATSVESVIARLEKI